MAVSTFKKMSGIAALAIGLAMALPNAASAQERGWNRGGGQSGEARQSGGEQRSAWQGRGGENRGGWRGNGGDRGQQAPRFQPPAQPQAQAPVQVQPQSQPQGINRWLGSRDGARSWRQDNPQQNAQRTPWNGGNQRGNWNRDNERHQGAQRNWNGNDNRWRGNDGRLDTRSRIDTRSRFDGNRNWNGNDSRRWNNNWRRDNRYDWFSYRNANRNLFRGDRYYSPYRNWSYRRLSIGFMLQPLFYSSTYWIDDPWQYRLPDAYGPYRWVRYYDDALLVDIYTGEVVDVINDFFW